MGLERNSRSTPAKPAEIGPWNTNFVALKGWENESRFAKSD